MLQAELRGKTATASGDDTRLEDTLTSAVVGGLAYLPRVALGAVLATTFPDVDWRTVDLDRATFQFWPSFSDGTEPDVLLTVGQRLIVVEAKYRSGFGVRQLEREWEGAHELAAARGADEVLLLALTASTSGEPTEVAQLRTKVGGGSRVAHVSWHVLAGVLEGVDLETAGAERLRDDIVAVMERRGVRHVYTGIELEDWWLVSAAQRTARERVYPQVAALARELQQSLEPDGVRWGVREDKIVHHHSTSLGLPASWARSYLQLPFWPRDFPVKGRGTSWWATFHVLLDFLQGDISVGYLTRPQTVTAARTDWAALVPQLLRATHSLDASWRITTSHGNLAVPDQSTHPGEWREEELRASIARPASHIVLERRVALPDLTSGELGRRMILETIRMVRDNPVWLPPGSGGLLPDPAPEDLPVADDEALQAAESEAVEDAGRSHGG
ncbi:hypothetical protein INN71_08685 [Nocardioides sp. ChNu-153]|uniref:hypothetical protein n=1 Tax=Nocardioides sp. ChNu-153 TaxID=2779364 RepID=UPI00264E61AD|nr:hypothetical protein [Nocardioides sp. ChNu-153]MDN7121465.1 hypothetical protein [Nocardioides sp. ChNu-153]